MRRDAARLRAYRARGELSGGSQSRRYQERDEEKKAKGQHRSKRQYVVAGEVRSFDSSTSPHDIECVRQLHDDAQSAILGTVARAPAAVCHSPRAYFFQGA